MVIKLLYKVSIKFLPKVLTQKYPTAEYLSKKCVWRQNVSAPKSLDIKTFWRQNVVDPYKRSNQSSTFIKEPLITRLCFFF